MAKPRNKAVVAGLTLTLTFGCLSVPALATTASGQAEDAAQRNLPAPSDFDRTDEFDNGSMSQVAIELAAVDTRAVAAISDEMKYFTRFESNCNYDQGFSYGDGYNAMGYYQFDRLMRSCRSSSRSIATTRSSTACSKPWSSAATN